MEDASILFTAARASLKPRVTPEEKPINPPRVSRRQGQPTIGITPDKMAAFLDEMKSVRLRKTGRDLESSKSFSSGSSRPLSGSSSLSTPSSRVEEVSGLDNDVSFLSRSLVAPRFHNQVVPVSALAGPRVGDKRKRRDTLDVILQKPHGKFVIPFRHSF